MKIELKEIAVRDLVKGYKDSQEEGVFGYDGKLNIRPAFQREFVYKDKQRDEVINTIRKGFPLNILYWVKNGNNTYELLDGQQRTISICQYINGDYSIDYKYYHNLVEKEKEQILDYKLMVYICEGDDREKLDWFKTINIAGEKLTEQELRNAIYTGSWLSDAKQYFSKTSCPAFNMANNYLSGTPIRQDYLETVIDWISNKKIEDYMSTHQHDDNASELWVYFQEVLDWIKRVFPTYRKEMKGLEWGLLYNQYKDNKYDPKKIDSEVNRLMQDDDVTSKKGIYSYLLSSDEKHLSIRAFTDSDKRIAFERQQGVCVNCKKTFTIAEMEGDHIKPWVEGGKTNQDNLQMLCRDCNRRKSSK